ncbi:MAG TPA: hypothetical protein DEP35_00010 [Deltaproteobacteria bacterium]|nr:hypothetical protein [Deltaproteobacteria bacterium]
MVRRLKFVVVLIGFSSSRLTAVSSSTGVAFAGAVPSVEPPVWAFAEQKGKRRRMAASAT